MQWHPHWFAHIRHHITSSLLAPTNFSRLDGPLASPALLSGLLEGIRE